MSVAPLFNQTSARFVRSDLLEKNSMMRTKAMREKDEQRERRKYNYTLLRVRLPDGTLLQGPPPISGYDYFP